MVNPPHLLKGPYQLVFGKLVNDILVGRGTDGNGFPLGAVSSEERSKSLPISRPAVSNVGFNPGEGRSEAAPPATLEVLDSSVQRSGSFSMQHRTVNTLWQQLKTGLRR